MIAINIDIERIYENTASTSVQKYNGRIYDRCIPH